MKKRVLVLQHVAPEGPGLIATALAAAEVDVRILRLDHGAAVPESLGDAAGLVVMGGPMGVGDDNRHPFLKAEKALLRRAVEERRPVLGVCLGAQQLAAALGAEVKSSGRQEIGWHALRLGAEAENDVLFRKLESAFTPLSWHGDVFALPKGALPLASSALTPLQAFRYGSSAWGLLFHLEVTRAMVEEMALLFQKDLAAAGVAPEAILSGMARHLSRSQELGLRVFGRWARTLS